MRRTVEQQLAADITSVTERQMLGAVALAEKLAARGWVNPDYAAIERDNDWAEMTVHLQQRGELCTTCKALINHGAQCCMHVKLRTQERLYECARCAVLNGRRGFPVPDAEPSAS